MDEQNIPQPSEAPTIPTKKLSPTIFILIIMLVMVMIGAGAFYYGQQSIKTKTASDKVVIPTPTLPMVPPAISTTAQPTVTNPVSKNVDKDKIKTEIESSTSPKMLVELLDVSPVDASLIVYLGHNENWDKFGVYFYDQITKKSTVVYEVTESIGGRGGYYMDNTALEFSPTGEAFFVNRTGINFPSLLIVSSKGSILYKGDKDVGHPTWVSGQKVVYLAEGKSKPQVFDINTKKSAESQLPENIFHLKANSSGSVVLAFSLPKDKLLCDTFDLYLLSYPNGNELKLVQNTTLVAKWSDDKNIDYEKVTECKKNTGESMSEYSPITEKAQVSIK